MLYTSVSLNVCAHIFRGETLLLCEEWTGNAFIVLHRMIL